MYSFITGLVLCFFFFFFKFLVISVVLSIDPSFYFVF
jgi:hypothetical protein